MNTYQAELNRIQQLNARRLTDEQFEALTAVRMGRATAGNIDILLSAADDQRIPSGDAA